VSDFQILETKITETESISGGLEEYAMIFNLTFLIGGGRGVMQPDNINTIF
jgi:hypothetical protein